MRLGRSYSEYRLQRPQAVFAPAAPTRQQQTIQINSVAVKTRVLRGASERQFPLQGWYPGLVKTTEAAAQTWGQPARLVGLRPPGMILPLPTKGMQTVTVLLRAVDRVQAAYQRRAPYSKLLPPTVLRVPSVEQREQTILVGNQAVQPRRNTESRRFPLQGWAGNSVVGQNSPYGFSGNIGTFTSSNSSYSFGETAGNNVQAAQMFHSMPGMVSSLIVPIKNVFNLTTNVTAQIQTDAGGQPSGIILGTSNAVNGTSIPNTFTPTNFSFVSPVVVPNGGWWVVLIVSTPGNGYNWQLATIPDLANPSALFDGTSWFQPGGSLVASFSGTISPDIALTRRFLGPHPPLVILPLPSQQQQTVGVKSLPQALVRREQAQQRAPKSLLFPVQTLAQPPPPFFGPQVNLLPVDRISRRDRRHNLTFFLSPPTVITTVTQTFNGPPPTLAHTRPRKTATRLAPPTALQVFSGPAVHTVRTRPRPTTRFLGKPQVVRVPSVEQREQTIQAALVHIRPRPKSALLRPPTVLQVFAGPRVSLTQTRPRRTTRLLSPPVVVTVVTQTFPGPAVRVVRTRPPKTVSQLGPLIFYPQTSEIQVTTVRTRPRKTRWFLAPPATLEPEAVQIAERQIRVELIHIRPRPTSKHLSPPAALQVFFGPQVTLTRIRPRPTARFLGEPTVVRVPSVEQQEQTIKVTLTRARPRPTTKVLGEPTTLQEFFGPAEFEVAVRIPLEDKRRPSHFFLRPPQVIRVPSVEQQEQTVRVSLTQTRPRRTGFFLRLPTVIRVPSVEQQEQTVRVALVHTRPHPTTKAVFPPTVLARPPQAPIAVTEVAVKTRFDWKRRFPLQGFRQRLIRETGAGTGSGLQGFDPLLGPRPPQIVLPLPTQREQTVKVTLALRPRAEAQRRQARYRLIPPTKVIPLPTLQMQTIQTRLVAVRTRVEQQRHAPHSLLSEPTVVAHAAFFGPSVFTVKTRPRSTVRVLSPPTIVRVPSVEQQLRTITVALVHTRPRPTARILLPPTQLRVFSGPTTVLTKTRPRPTRRFLRPPTVVRVPSVEQAEQTIRVVSVRTRPHPTAKFVRPAQVVAQPPVETVLATTLTRTRPRPKAALLQAPTVLRVFRAAQVFLVKIRPRPTRATLAAPVVVAEPPVKTQTSVSLVRARPRPTAKALFAPTVVLPLLERTLKVILAGRTRSEASRRAPHSHLGVPVTIVPPPGLGQQTIRVVLAGRTRAELSRRAPHLHLEPPTVVFPPVIVRLGGKPGTPWGLGEPSLQTAVPLEPEAETEWSTGEPTLETAIPPEPEISSDWGTGDPI